MQVPAPFDYARASSVDEAIALLDRLGPEARLVAGGHSLLPMIKLRLPTPEPPVGINPPQAELRLGRGGDRGGPNRAPPPPPRHPGSPRAPPPLSVHRW